MGKRTLRKCLAIVAFVAGIVGTSACVTSNDSELLLDGKPDAGAQENASTKAEQKSNEEKVPETESSPRPLSAPQVYEPQIHSQKDRDSISPPVDHQTQGMVFSLPKNTTQIAVSVFLNDYRPSFQKYSDLLNEYRAYFLGVNAKSEADAVAKEALRARVRENFERSHWVFVHGDGELNYYMASTVKGVVVGDREENFVARMKTLSFLAKELSEISNDKKYSRFAREIYIRQSEISFGRKLVPVDDLM